MLASAGYGAPEWQAVLGGLRPRPPVLEEADLGMYEVCMLGTPVGSRQFVEEPVSKRLDEERKL